MSINAVSVPPSFCRIFYQPRAAVILVVQYPVSIPQKPIRYFPDDMSLSPVSCLSIHTSSLDGYDYMWMWFSVLVSCGLLWWDGPSLTIKTFQIRSGRGAYAGAARRRVHLVTVLLRPPSGHRPGRCQARHARIPQIGLDRTQP